MSHASVRYVLLFALFAVAATLTGSAGRAQEKSWAEQTREVLTKRLTLDQPLENVPLRDVLDFLGEKGGLSNVVFDEVSFKKAASADAENRPVKLPRLKNVPVQTLLAMALRQAECTYRLEKDHLLVLPAKSDDAVRVRAWQDKLNQPVTLEGAPHGMVTLAEFLNWLGTKHGLGLVINSAAFRRDAQIDDLGSRPIHIPQVPNQRLGRYLRILLDQVEAVYVVRADHVEITTLAAAYAGDPISDLEAPLRTFPLVYTVFEQRPLHEALQELADLTDCTVVLDGNRSQERRDMPVSATFKNVPLNSAVEVLADMAELKSVRIGKVIYVTSAENAQVLLQEQEKRGMAVVQPGM